MLLIGWESYMVNLKQELIDMINRLKDEEQCAKSLGNEDMASGICLSRVMAEEVYRKAYGDIPATITQEQ